MLPMRTNTDAGANRRAGLTTTSSPLALIDEVRREMDRVFDQMLGTWNDPTLASPVEVPGLDPDDLHVDVTDDVLTISGERKVERDETEGAYRLVERRAGRFERRVSLPTHVDAEHVTAEYEHGVLTVRIPKRADAKKSRRVEIKGSAFQKFLGRGKRDAGSQKENAEDAHA